MAGYWLASGIADFTEIALGSGASPVLALGLYTNNHTPNWEDDTGLYVECAAPGYAEVSIPYSNWSVNINSSSPNTNSGPPCVFSGTNRGSPAETLYGYFLINTATGLIWYAELFGSPYVLPAADWFYIVVPTFTMGQCGAC